MDEVTKSLIQYGIAGICLAASFYLIFFLLKSHIVERKEWKSTVERQFEKIGEMNEHHLTALNRIETLLETLVRSKQI